MWVGKVFNLFKFLLLFSSQARFPRTVLSLADKETHASEKSLMFTGIWQEIFTWKWQKKISQRQTHFLFAYSSQHTSSNTTRYSKFYPSVLLPSYLPAHVSSSPFLHKHKRKLRPKLIHVIQGINHRTLTQKRNKTKGNKLGQRMQVFTFLAKSTRCMNFCRVFRQARFLWFVGFARPRPWHVGLTATQELSVAFSSSLQGRGKAGRRVGGIKTP